MESIFRKYFTVISSQNVNIKEFYLKQMSTLCSMEIPDCHNLKNKIIQRFVVFRLKISSKKQKHASVRHSSKTLAGSLL